jgi:hypothetical protein
VILGFGNRTMRVNRPANAAPRVPVALIPLRAIGLVALSVAACSVWANLAFAVTNPVNYRYFPPFKQYVNTNANDHLGGEYFNMARSLVAGEGFANPFDRRTGPTAWQPPVLPALLAGLLWIAGGSRTAVMVCVIVFQDCVLIGTGLLVLALARQTNRRLGASVAAALFVTVLLCQFSLCFQATHDYWFVLLAVDLLVASFCWLAPLSNWKKAAGWGVFGGVCALISPIVGLVWGSLSLFTGGVQRKWSALVITGFIALLVLMPWAVRNWVVLGRLIPMKSNLAYELYQSQCLQRDGMLQASTFLQHPYGGKTREGEEYDRLGEVGFVERKRQQFLDSVRADPAGFLERVANRFLGATVWYLPFDRDAEAKRAWVLRISRWTHPLPFLALVVLMFTAMVDRLQTAQWIVLGVYCLYLLPYIGASYYERYAVPLVGVKALLVIWAADRLLSLRVGRSGVEQSG